MPIGEPIRISASSFVSFGECKQRTGLRFEGRFGPDSLPAFRGGLAHQVFARHLRHGPIAPEDFPQVCREEIGAKHLNLKIASLNLKPSAIRGVIDEVGALYERFKSFPTTGFRGAEISIEQEVGTGVTLVGSIDAVFESSRSVRLVDWKTGGLGDPLIQLRFYALLWFLEHGDLPDTVQAYSVKTGEQREEPPTRDGVQDVADRVAAMVNELRSAWADGCELERRAGPWCRSCPVLDECSEGQAASNVFGPASSVLASGIG